MVSVQQRIYLIEFKLNCIQYEANSIFHRGVLIKRAHYYDILEKVARTIMEGVLIKLSALTEGVWYSSFSLLFFSWVHALKGAISASLSMAAILLNRLIISTSLDPMLYLSSLFLQYRNLKKDSFNTDSIELVGLQLISVFKRVR